MNNSKLDLELNPLQMHQVKKGIADGNSVPYANSKYSWEQADCIRHLLKDGFLESELAELLNPNLTQSEWMEVADRLVVEKAADGIVAGEFNKNYSVEQSKI